MSLPEFTLEEVATHNSSDSLWIAIEGKVFDVTSFQADVRAFIYEISLTLSLFIMLVLQHPGGTEVLLDNAGKNLCILGVREIDRWKSGGGGRG